MTKNSNVLCLVGKSDEIDLAYLSYEVPASEPVSKTLSKNVAL